MVGMHLRSLHRTDEKARRSTRLIGFSDGGLHGGRVREETGFTQCVQSDWRRARDFVSSGIEFLIRESAALLIDRNVSVFDFRCDRWNRQ